MALHTKKITPAKYLRETPFHRRLGRWLKKHLIIIPILSLGLGIGLYVYLARHFPGFGFAPQVNYDQLLTDPPAMPPPRDLLDSYREDFKAPRASQSTILSGEKLLSVNYGTEIKAFTDISQAYQDSILQLQEQLASLKNLPAAPLPTTSNSKRKRRKRKKKIILSDKPKTTDTVERAVRRKNLFHTLKPSKARDQKQYAKVFVDGQQAVGQGQYIRLRLGEDFEGPGGLIPQNTLFYGKAQLAAHKILITVSNIGPYTGTYRLLDGDFSEGLILPGRRDDFSQATGDYLHRSTPGYLDAIPFEALSAVGRQLAARKRAKRHQVVLPDGYRLYLTLKQSS